MHRLSGVGGLEFRYDFSVPVGKGLDAGTAQSIIAPDLGAIRHEELGSTRQIVTLQEALLPKVGS
jgi:hypothetical protein